MKGQGVCGEDHTLLAKELGQILNSRQRLGVLECWRQVSCPEFSITRLNH
jgi:hypothetical protein